MAMRKNRQMQLILILAICVSIVGISLGFAAFSNTLTISSSAIVKPDQKDFFLRAYGLAEANMDEDLWSYEPYKSTNISKPFIYGGSATDAIIESSNCENGKNDIKSCYFGADEIFIVLGRNIKGHCTISCGDKKDVEKIVPVDTGTFMPILCFAEVKVDE